MDKTAQTLTQAIAMQEGGGKLLPYDRASGDEPNAPQGTAGGRYQFTADTWKNYAGQVLGDANAPMTDENQNKVAYTKVKNLLDSGKTPAQVASSWNAGEGEPDAWTGKFSNGNPSMLKNPDGTTKFDVPNYVKNVQNYAQQLDGQTQNNQSTDNSSANDASQQQLNIDTNGYVTNLNLPKDNSGQQAGQDQSLPSELVGRAQDIGSAVSDTISGKINPLSGILQGVGAVAGGLGDVVNKGIELIPGVKALEGVIGDGVSKLVQTPGGQAIMKSMKDWSTEHPELSKDIGAGFNIITAIPILRGLGTITNIALDSASVALKNVAEKTFTKEVTSFIGKDATQVTKDMIEKNIIPDVKNGTYDVTKALNKVGELRKNIQSTKGLTGGIKLNNIETALRAMSNKPVTTSTFGNVVKKVGNIGLSKLAGGNLVGDYVGNKLEGATTGILKRTAPGASRVGIKGGVKGLAKIGGGVGLQKANQASSTQ